MTFNLKYFVLACTMAVVIIGNVLVAAETRQLRGGSVDGSICVLGDTCEYNRTCLIGSKQIICNSLSSDVRGTFVLRDNNPDIPPTRRLDTTDVVFTPVDGGYGISSGSSTPNNKHGNDVAFTAANPCPIQITLDSRSSSQGGGPVSNGNCSGYTGGKCEYSRDRKSYARCDCQPINNRVVWRCYPNP